MTKTVMLIEDNMLHRKLFAAWLETGGHRPVLIADERFAYVEAVAQQPDVIITDIRLPYVDGREIIRQLKASPLTKHIPVLAMTVLSGRQDEQSCRAAGAGCLLYQDDKNGGVHPAGRFDRMLTGRLRDAGTRRFLRTGRRPGGSKGRDTTGRAKRQGG